MIHNKRVPSIDGMEIDKAHKGGGGGKGGGLAPLNSISNALGVNKTLDKIGIGSSNELRKINDFNLFAADPGGLLYTPENQDLLEVGASFDLAGIGNQKVLNAQVAEKAKQDALAAEMEARRLAASAQPLEERAKLNYNQSAFGSGLGSLGLIVDTQATKRSASTGLGGIDKASAGLGFGSKSKVGK